MPRQNRVTPFGDIIAVPERGMFMGNRGCLHGEHGQLGQKRWARKAWVTCTLTFKGRRREVMAPGEYTELFFLDEATALAAGHRPCAECRRQDFERFKRLWLENNAGLLPRPLPTMAEIDAFLHEERVDRQRRQRHWWGAIGEVPDGAMIKLPNSQAPWLLWRGRLREWTPSGYRLSRRLPEGEVEVITPRSVCRVLAAGYVPQVHPSADA